MEVKNNGSLNLADYLKSASSTQSFSSSNTSDFHDFFLENTSKKQDFQKDSQKHYLKDKVNNDDIKNNKAIDSPKNDFNKDVENFSKDDNAIYSSDEVESNVATEKTDKSEKTEKTDKSKKVDESDDDKTVKEDDAEKIKKLAEILGVSEEKLLATLQELNISIDDLTDVENVKDLLVSVNNLEGKIDLLSLDNLKDIMKKIDDLANAETVDAYEEMTELASQAIDVETNDDSTESETNTNSNSSQATASSNSIETDVQVLDVEVSPEETEQNHTNMSATNDVKTEGVIVNATLTNVETNQTQATNTVEINDVNIQGGVKLNNESSFVSQVAKTLGTRQTDTENIIKQITDAMKVEVKGDVANEVKITLRPAHLGDVTLKIATDNGVITAQFEAESQRVKEIIESNFNQLKDSLQKQGIDISHLTVTVNDNNQTNQFNNNSSGNRENNRSSSMTNGVEGSDDSINEVVVEESQVVGSRSSYKA